jgi:hypothetical protein
MRHGMEQFSISMFWLALAATAMATLLYWGHVLRRQSLGERSSQLLGCVSALDSV